MVRASDGRRSAAGRPKSGKGKDDEIPLMELDEYIDIGEKKDVYEFEGDKPFQRHDIQLWISDSIILIIEHMQFYALMLSLSERWGWPIQWIDTTMFTFVFNLDIWEFRKAQKGLFNRSASAFIDTAKVGFDYTSYLASWAVLMIIIFVIFGAVYFRWMKRRPLHLLMYVAYWKRIMFLLLEVLSFPFGVAIARVFHCRENKYTNKMVMDVQNEHECFTAIHVAFMVVVSLIFLGLFIIYPLVLSRWINEQLFTGQAKRHEGYLQLKEAEYEQGLDVLWDLGQYHLFSSFRRFWVYYNPLKFALKLIFLGCFAASTENPFYTSAIIAFVTFMVFFMFIIKRPFRVGSFNFMIIISYAALFSNVLFGNFMVVPPWTEPAKFVPPEFLRMPTILQILQLTNIVWLALLFLWIVYLLSVHTGFLCGKNTRIWPRLSYEDSNTVGEDTKKYLKAALKARHTLEHTLAAVPLFAPVHEIGYQVKVINAYSREAELIGDPTHDTLWDLLDELIEAHNHLTKISVFGSSGKNSVRETSVEFIKLMPAFRRRLAQREYDFILVPAKKRRLLLKMYVLGVFVNGRKQRLGPEAMIKSKLQEDLEKFDQRSDIFDISEYETDSSRAPTSFTDTDASRMSSRIFKSGTGMRDSVDGFLDALDLEALVSSKPHNVENVADNSSSDRPASSVSDRPASSNSNGSSKSHRSVEQRKPSPVEKSVENLSSSRLSVHSQAQQDRSESPLLDIRRSESLINMELPASMRRPADSRPSTAPLEGTRARSRLLQEGSSMSLPGQILEEEHESRMTGSSDGSIQLKPDNLINLTTPSQTPQQKY